MYRPDVFALDDAALIGEAMRRHDFALLVTAPGGRPRASHLPFLFEPDSGDHGALRAHMARANPQWKDFANFEAEGGDVLVVFQGPHAYVSPRWYGAGPAVPTWNYVAIHAYGRPRIIDDPIKVRALIEQLVETQESALAQPWSMASLDEKYLARMLRGIVAFEISLTRIEAKAKLNQNKSPDQRQGVVAALGASGDPRDAEVAALMTALAPEP